MPQATVVAVTEKNGGGFKVGETQTWHSLDFNAKRAGLTIPAKGDVIDYDISDKGYVTGWQATGTAPVAAAGNGTAHAGSRFAGGSGTRKTVTTPTDEDAARRNRCVALSSAAQAAQFLSFEDGETLADRSQQILEMAERFAAYLDTASTAELPV